MSDRLGEQGQALLFPALGGFQGGNRFRLVVFHANQYAASLHQAAEQLQAAPARTSDWTSDRNWERATYDHYGVPFYWF